MTPLNTVSSIGFPIILDIIYAGIQFYLKIVLGYFRENNQYTKYSFICKFQKHDYVIKWKLYSALLALYEGIPPFTETLVIWDGMALIMPSLQKVYSMKPP